MSWNCVTIILQLITNIIISVLYLQVVNTETEMQNSQEAVDDDDDYVGETQMVVPSDTFPQGNLQSSGHQRHMRLSL
jgi:hypothetical protein